MKTSLRACFALLVAGALFASSPISALAQDVDKPVEQVSLTTEEGVDVLAALKEAGQYSKLIAALEKTGIARQLESATAFTLFAPTDSAFDKATSFNSMSMEEMTEVLRGHLVMETIPSEKATDMETVLLANGGEAKIVSESGKTMIGEATIVTPDIMSTNGVIHGIDTVLKPAAKKSDEDNNRR